MLQSPYATLVLMWIIFAVVHSGLASGVVMRGVGEKMGKYYRPVLFVTCIGCASVFNPLSFCGGRYYIVAAALVL
jgi:hypothetical protein